MEDKMHHNIKRGMWKDRRGEDMLVDFWAIIVFAVIVLLFLIMFAFNKGSIEQNTNTQFGDKDADFMLQSFLRAPAIGYDETKTVAEMIAEEDANGDFIMTEQLCKEYFKLTSIIGNEKIFEMNIEIKGNTEEKFTPIKKSKDGNSRRSYAQAYIPGYNIEISIELEVWSIFNPGRPAPVVL